MFLFTFLCSLFFWGMIKILFLILGLKDDLNNDFFYSPRKSETFNIKNEIFLIPIKIFELLCTFDISL